LKSAFLFAALNLEGSVQLYGYYMRVLLFAVYNSVRLALRQVSPVCLPETLELYPVFEIIGVLLQILLKHHLELPPAKI
jgi:hypothetical protein